MALMKVGAILFCAIVLLLLVSLGWLGESAWAGENARLMNDAKATLFVGGVAAWIAIMAAAIAFWGVYSQRVIARRQATILHLAALEGDKNVKENIQKFIKLTQGAKNLAAYADLDQQGSDETITITAILNQFELISTGIQHGIFEYELIYRWQRTSIQRYWTAANPFVVAVRNRVGAPSLWIEFERLNTWVSGKKSPFFALWWTGLG